MEQIRSFIAIELPEELKQALSRLQGSLMHPQQTGVKWVDPASIHITLKFLGNVNSDRISDILRVMEESARGIPPFTLEARDVGAFPNLKRPQVVWVGITGQLDMLQQLQRRIESSLVPLGFPAENRPFTAHLTLARLRNQVAPFERQKLSELLAATRFEAPVNISVEAINLMKSQITPSGAIYTRIGSVKL